MKGRRKDRRATGICVTPIACAIAISLWSNGAHAVADDDIIEIHGMRIDLHLATKRQRKAVVPSLTKQIAVATSVHVPEDVLRFFRTITIVVDPAMLSMSTNGQYMQTEKVPYVRIKPISLPEERAIVLHELMHAYHHQVLKSDTPDIRAAYARAQRDSVYPSDYRDAAFLRDTREYFANMATTFLLGQNERPPFSCEKIQKAQPKFVAYLSTLFGPQQCP